jgi:hypothetical protein
MKLKQAEMKNKNIKLGSLEINRKVYIFLVVIFEHTIRQKIFKKIENVPESDIL